MGGQDGALLSLSNPSAHDGIAHVEHDRADIGEIQVDQAMDINQVRDAPGGLMEDTIGQLEGVGEGGAGLSDPQERFVGDRQEGIAVGAQLLDAFLGPARALGAFEGERPGDDGHR